MMLRPLATALSCALLIIGGGCGGANGDPLPSEPPPRVPEGLTPDSLGGGELVVRPYMGEEAKKAFAGAGEQALVADGKLWEIRDGETLVGVLQISTLKNTVDLRQQRSRDAILGGVLSGGTKRIDIEGLTVSFSETEDQTKYVWFGKRLFEVLTLKTSRVEPEPILQELLRFQTSREIWEALPRETDEPEG